MRLGSAVLKRWFPLRQSVLPTKDGYLKYTIALAYQYRMEWELRKVTGVEAAGADPALAVGIEIGVQPVFG